MLQMYMYQFKSLQLALSESTKPVKFYHITKHFIEHFMSCSNKKVKTEFLRNFDRSGQYCTQHCCKWN